MRTTDLQIGNFVLYESQVARVKQILEGYVVIEKISSDVITANVNDLYPVELDTDWLIRLSFSKSREVDKDNDIDGMWHNNGIILYEDFWDNVFNFATYTKNGEFKSGYTIKYVHNLQNLYKSLTTIDL